MLNCRLHRASAAPLVLAALVGVSWLSLAGCSGRSPQAGRATGRADRPSAPDIDSNFEKSAEQLHATHRYDSREVALQCTFDFNAYLESRPKVDWERDPLLSTLPQEIRESRPVQRLDAVRVEVDDVEAIEAEIWLRNVVRWGTRAPLDEPLAAWLESRRESLGRDAAVLELAIKLFDWTARNIQAMPYQEGQPPGAWLTIRESLLLGLGDPMIRSRIFMHLAAQAGIPCVMVAFERGDGEPPQPWAPAALVGGELYLFDPALGLPIPAAGEQGVATLDELVEHPEWLRQLDLGEADPYPIQAADLKFAALIDGDPRSLSRRMRLLEGRLVGDHQVTLTCRPSSIREQLRDCTAIQRTLLWDIPFHAFSYEQGLQQQMLGNSRLREEYQARWAVFQGAGDLVMGRKAHLNGVFETIDGEPGAIKRYADVRYPDLEIAALAISTEVQKMHDLTRGEYEREEEFAQRVAKEQARMRDVKMFASYWLGLLQFDLEAYKSCTNWLGVRTLQERPDSIWTPGARYCLGRAYERLGEFQQARETYLDDQTFTRQGSLLRARRIEAE